MNNSPFLDTAIRSEREARRERAIRVVRATARGNGASSQRIQAIENDLRGAFLMADLINSMGGVR